MTTRSSQAKKTKTSTTKKVRADVVPPSERRTKVVEGTVKEFLESYGDALSAGHGEHVAEMWEVPAYVLADADARVVSGADEVAKFFSSAHEAYAAHGIVSTFPEIQNEFWFTERLVSVDVRWPRVDARGAEVGHELATYILRLDDEGMPRIRIAIMHGETSR